MPYAPEVLSRARARLRERKEAKAQEYLQHQQIAYEKYPRLQEIDHELRATMAQAVAACLAAGGDPANTIAEIRRQNQSLQREREWILDASELGEGYLDDSPCCIDCGGSGYIGQTMCHCLADLCREEQQLALSNLLGLGEERFENFQLHYYSTEPDPTYGISPRENMNAVFRKVRAWAQNFTPDAGSLLLTGGTGLGKTYLSACAARKVSELGYSVVYESASRLLSDFETEHFGNEPPRQRTEKYFCCDLLILDDLGTEMANQFVISALYQLLNTRLMERRSVIISTNLTLDQIRTRYGVQLYSRIAGTYEGLLFFGRDIRLAKQ